MIEIAKEIFLTMIKDRLANEIAPGCFDQELFDTLAEKAFTGAKAFINAQDTAIVPRQKPPPTPAPSDGR